MIQIIIVDFAKQVAHFEFDSNYEMMGELLADTLGTLDLFARELSIAPLSSFAGTVEADFDPYQASNEDESWFSPIDAINTINGLLDFLQRRPSSAKSKTTARYARTLQKYYGFEVIVQELDDLREILRSAQSQSKDARFKFILL